MTESKAKHEIADGICPICGAELEYGNQDVQDEYKWYDVSCGRCGWQGRQWDKVTFTGYTVEDENTGEAINVEPSAREQMDKAVTDRLTSDKVIEKLINALDSMTEHYQYEHQLDHEEGYIESEPGEDCLGCEEIKQARMLLDEAEDHKLERILVEVRGGVAYCDDPRVEIIDHDNH